MSVYILVTQLLRHYLILHTALVSVRHQQGATHRPSHPCDRRRPRPVRPPPRNPPTGLANEARKAGRMPQGGLCS